MRNWRIIVFIWGVFSLLAVVCLVFPKDDVEITLRFPSLEEVFSSKKDTVDLEKSLQNIENDFVASLDTLSEITKNADSLCFIDSLSFYVRFDTTSAARLYFPNNDPSVLDGVFEALENQSKDKMLHILHYGDSQIELDRISGYFRQRLQEQFGGMGTGLLPIVPLYQTTSVGQVVSDSLPRYVASGTMRQTLPHNRYGVLAQMATLNGAVTLSYTSRDWKQVYEGTKRFSVARLFVGNVKAGFKAKMTANGKDSTIILSSDSFDLTELSWNFGGNVSSCTMRLNGSAELYGVSLESQTGVTVDNIALRGSAGTFFTKISSSLLGNSMTVLNVPLILLEYGGNAVPSVTSKNMVENYKKDFARQLRYLQKCYPDAFIIVIGPADMSTKINGELQTWPFVEDVVLAMKEAALENGAAFWNMFEVMGGRNSMIQWVSHKPAWAAPDYIHFTQIGAKRIAEVFTESFFHYYDYYSFLQRNAQWVRKDDVDSVEYDSLFIDSSSFVIDSSFYTVFDNE